MSSGGDVPRGTFGGVGDKEICGKTLARVLKGQMSKVCRTQGCPGRALDELGYCDACHHRYERDRGAERRLAVAARREHWELFACLAEPEAWRLAEHLIGHARIGRRSVMWAIADFVAEAREAQPGCAGRGEPVSRPRPRPQLRLIHGGAR